MTLVTSNDTFTTFDTYSLVIDSWSWIQESRRVRVAMQRNRARLTLPNIKRYDILELMPQQADHTISCRSIHSKRVVHRL